MLEEMLLQPDDYFVDRAMILVQSRFDKFVQTALEEHFTGTEKLLQEFSTLIKSQALLDYTVSEEGEAIRADVELENSETPRESR
jgi:hypothetical protein